MREDGHAEKFIVTFDLGEKLEALGHSNLTVPDPRDEIVVSIQNRIRADLDVALDPCEVVALPVAKLSTDIYQKLSEHHDVHDMLIVSSVPEGIIHSDIIPLQGNRVYTSRGTMLGIGPRPGNPALAVQIGEIKRLARGRPVALIEDGIFSGNTLITIVDNMREFGIMPKLIATGFAFERSTAALEKLKSTGITVLTVHHFGRLRDWMPDHDFVPFTPGCGRVIGAPVAGDGTNPALLRANDDITYSVPYLYPFTGDTETWEEWTGIPKASAREFSRNRVNDAIDLFEYLEQLNNRSILIKDLMLGRQRVSVAVAVDQGNFPDGDERVIDYLADVTSVPT